MKLISTCALLLLLGAPVIDIQSASNAQRTNDDSLAEKSPTMNRPRSTPLQPRIRQNPEPPLKAISQAIQNDSSIESRLARIGGYIRAYEGPRGSQHEKTQGLYKAYAEATFILQQLNSQRGRLAVADELRDSPAFRVVIRDLCNTLGDAVDSLERMDSQLQIKIQQAMSQLTHAEKLVSAVQKRLEQQEKSQLNKFKG